MTTSATGSNSRPQVRDYELAVPSELGTFVLMGGDESVTGLLLPDTFRLTWANGPNGARGNGGSHGATSPSAVREVLGRQVPEALQAAATQLQEYLGRQRKTFDLPLRPLGTEFQRSVWLALAEIPYGETISYAELASWVGRPGAFRAVGQANGANPLPIFFPCHRVVASGGKIGGYGGGLTLKRALLELEVGANGNGSTS